MSETLNPDLEDRVLINFAEMARRYQSMNELVDTMREKQIRQQPVNHEMKELEIARADLERIESSGRADQEAYRQSRDHASAGVTATTHQIELSIKQLMVKIAELEQHTIQSYEKLIPEINQTVRINQMQQAYGQSK